MVAGVIAAAGIVIGGSAALDAVALGAAGVLSVVTGIAAGNLYLDLTEKGIDGSSGGHLGQGGRQRGGKGKPQGGDGETPSKGNPGESPKFGGKPPRPKGVGDKIDYYANVVPPFTDPFKEGEDTTTPVDPLILDLNGDGLKTSSVTDGVYFDLDCSGFAEQTGWASDEDGVLARDVDNDGWITDGSELFGDKTLLSNGSVATSGFQALADLDSTINGGNFDGKIDANDTAFTELGVIKGGSFFYLEELGIKEISLNYNDISDTIDENGNTLLSKSTYLTEDGRTLEIGEYDLDRLSYNTLPLEFDEAVDLSTVENLPEAIGYGNVHNLNYAMAVDETGELKALVEEFIYMGPDTENVLTPSERYALAA